MPARGRSPKLESTLARLYEVFSHYPANPDMDFCDHCISKEDVLELAATPLKSLTLKQADEFTTSALLTLGSVADLKHYLPRLMELAAQDPDFLTDLETLFVRLRYGEWLTWPPDEIKAVREYLHAFWVAQLSGAASHGPDATICAIAQAEDDLNPYLSLWLVSDSLRVADRLADFIHHNVNPMLKKRRLGNAWWKEREPQEMQVRAWLNSPAVKEKLEAIAVANSDSPLAEKIMDAAQLLQVFG